MRNVIRSFTIAGALGLASLSAGAQGGPPAGRPLPPGPPSAEARPERPSGELRRARMRARAIHRRAEARGVELSRRQVRDRMVAQRAVARERIQNMTPEQRQEMLARRQAVRAERQGIVAQVRAGTLTREQAREKLQALRKEHRPGMRGPKPPGGGY